MKNMSNFKGTQGEFKVTKGNMSDLEISNREVRAGVVPYSDEEGQANARLFANSKKVLEAAIELLRFKTELRFIIMEKFVTPDNAVKALKQLEQAINDSL